MEKSPKNARRTEATVFEDIAAIGREIVELESQMRSAHEESGGNSPEDNAQEAQADMTNQAILAERISSLRLRESELRAELAALEQKAT